MNILFPREAAKKRMRNNDSRLNYTGPRFLKASLCRNVLIGQDFFHWKSGIVSQNSPWYILFLFCPMLTITPVVFCSRNGLCLPFVTDPWITQNRVEM